MNDELNQIFDNIKQHINITTSIESNPYKQPTRSIKRKHCKPDENIDKTNKIVKYNWPKIINDKIKIKCINKYLNETKPLNHIRFTCCICDEFKPKDKILTIDQNLIITYKNILHKSNLSYINIFDNNEFIYKDDFANLNDLVLSTSSFNYED